MVNLMQDTMIITSGEWVLLTLATIALVHGAVTCMNLRKTVVRAEARPAFSGLTAALSDVSKRAGRKAPKSQS